MMFCPRCGSIMKPRKEKNRNVLACSCGYVDSKTEGLKIKEELPRQAERISTDVATEEDEHLPVVDADCPKCGNGKAYFWMIQTRAGDEPETKFMRCTKCKHTWRDYS